MARGDRNVLAPDGFIARGNESPDNSLGDGSEARYTRPREGETDGKDRPELNVSLDGVMQSPGPTDVPFKYRGWAVDFDGGSDGGRFALESAQKSEVLQPGGHLRSRPGAVPVLEAHPRSILVVAPWSNASASNGFCREANGQAVRT
jgi:hypothetical protein